MTATVELTFQQLTAAVDQLPADLQEVLANHIVERLTANNRLLDGIDHPPPMSEAEVHAIIKHRLENPSPGRPWEVVEAELLAKYKKK